MKKLYILELDIDEEKMNTGNNIATSLGISDERAFELFKMASREGKKSPTEEFNALSNAFNLLASGQLTGNEIFFLFTLGYTAEVSTEKLRWEAKAMSSMLVVSRLGTLLGNNLSRLPQELKDFLDKLRDEKDKE